MASQLKRQEETKGPQNPALKGHERTGKSAEKQDSPPHDTDPNNKKKNSWSLGGLWQKPKTGGETAAGHEDGSGNKQKNLQKIGNYAKSLLKGWTDSLQNQLFVEPQPTSNNTTQDSIGQSKGGRVESNENNEDNEEEENEFDDEDEEGDEDDDEGEEADESEESEGYEEEEGSLEEEEEKEAAAEAKSNKRSEEKRPSIDNFAIDDDESPPIQHSAPSLEEAVEDKKHKEENPEKPKKKKAKKGKGKKKKSKGKKNQGARPKQQSDNLVFEDVYVNKNYAYGSLFTDFHQYYFKGDYLDFESDEFFRATLVNEKTAISNLLFNERRYLNIQDQVFYVTKLETVENYKLAMVLESFPLSRLVRLDKVDKKKRLDISFYTEDGGQNIQREMVYEIRNYHKFLRILNQNLQQVNSSYHILSFNIE